MIGGLQFFTNGGDTHPVLDKKGGIIKAEDLRIRFEVGGHLDDMECKLVQPDQIELTAGNVRASLRLLYGMFQDSNELEPTPLQWTAALINELWCVDVVIHSGEKRTFDFNQIRTLLSFSRFQMAAQPLLLLNYRYRDRVRRSVSAVERTTGRNWRLQSH